MRPSEIMDTVYLFFEKPLADEIFKEVAACMSLFVITVCMCLLIFILIVLPYMEISAWLMKRRAK